MWRLLHQHSLHKVTASKWRRSKTGARSFPPSGGDQKLTRGAYRQLAEIKNWRAELTAKWRRSKTDARGFPPSGGDQKLTRGAFRQVTEIKNWRVELTANWRRLKTGARGLPPIAGAPKPARWTRRALGHKQGARAGRVRFSFSWGWSDVFGVDKKTKAPIRHGKMLFMSGL